ncbi:MAG: FtsQ-type POTRA domain-containing protein [Rickettsiaceae bacterium]|nr:FtsQ-type POTRA domain-containing protein [Rickettsiaceae bacterium]MDP5020520.1 FtsQ-type POTRA domain-containing protein [Rickettsiaceae bacterium]
MLKITIAILLSLLIFTDLFKSFKDRMYDVFYQKTAKYGFVLQNVIIEGKKNAEYQDIVNLLKVEEGAPIFSINIQEVKERLETHIWLKAAIVERQLPSTIYIAVTERTPIAIWQFKQKLYLVDVEGNRIAKHEGQEFGDLIQVVGQDANIYAQALIDDLNRHPGLAGKVKSAVRYGQRRWNINLEQNITVKMPEDNFNEAYNYLYALDKNKRLFDQNYKMLDLRDSKKYYLEKY